MDKREKWINRIVECEVDGLEFDDLLESYKSYRRSDLEDVDDDTLQNILEEYREETEEKDTRER